ncbi:MlaD family protein [Mycolicibacterium cosmeticum]|uniref:MlaD family protein n=1 Tax=Mycolicibacterium cosmeticum TaxID=258533 RepID=UPI0032046BC6
MIGAVCQQLVRAVRAIHHRWTWLSGGALAVTLIVATTYLTFGALRAHPGASTYRITVELPQAGGLLPNRDITVRGARVGRIAALRISPDGVDAIADIASDVPIAASSQVRVSGLSPAGEQYIDLVPTSDAGPLLSDGSVIERNRATTPIQLAELLTDANGVLAQIDPLKLEIIKHELRLSAAGPAKLRDIVDGGTFLLATLDSVLPETVSLLTSSRIALTTLTDITPGLSSSSRDLATTLVGINGMDGGYRRLLDRTPGLLSAVDSLFADNSETMVGLLANLASTAQLLYVRVPALNALFPAYRGSTLEAISRILHDHGLWATADIYPRYTCDYGTPRRPPSSADFPEPFLYTYCRDDDPEVLIRGAKNAPRPAGDDTAGPPPGADLGRLADPTPRGRFTIPTPYGGPTLPIEPPR